MDLVLEAVDRHLLTPYVYPAGWPEDEPCRQLLSLFVITNLGALALYLLFGTLSYYFIFDHELKKHPHFLEVGAPRGLLTPSPPSCPLQMSRASVVARAVPTVTAPPLSLLLPLTIPDQAQVPQPPKPSVSPVLPQAQLSPNEQRPASHTVARMPRQRGGRDAVPLCLMRSIGALR